MDILNTLFYVAATSLILLVVIWIGQYGVLRGLMAGLCRGVWLLPLLLALFPRSKSESLPRTVALKTVHVLLDDSESMRAQNGESPQKKAETLVQNLTEECQRLGCQPKLTRLSDLNKVVQNGFTPLQQSLLPWLYGTGGEPWLLLSDGGDMRPTEPWDPKLEGFGKNGDSTRGSIVGFKPEQLNNLWIETPDTPLFSFVAKPLEINARLRREKPELDQETVQVQILEEDRPLISLNATFEKGEDAVDVRALVPPLAKGQHLLSIKALPTATESAIWDNQILKVVEVMPNTIGLLHLLGAPSWDGRFLRRYLKSEPKYDLISFFILRDPGDAQMVNERELSLIPFPVDRLFTEELPNFHSVVIQNFALYQFLEPTYQENLVKFVQNGGGLLFIGGPRALQAGDIANSPLASILPFHLKGGTQGKGLFTGKGTPTYDADLPYKIEMAKPNSSQRSLANVFDEWEKQSDSLTKLSDLRGLHHMEQVEFKEGEYTPLLYARLPNQTRVPLAVASYPGKGRALWIFSDALWQLAQNPPADSSREVYNDFFRSSVTWLLRQELRKSLIVKNFHISLTGDKTATWQMHLAGPAARYFRADPSWRLDICQVSIPVDKLVVEQTGPEDWLLSGKISGQFFGGQRCVAKVSGDHSAFGALQSSVATVIPETYSDREVQAAPNKLESLSRLTGADLSFSVDGSITSLQGWLENATGTHGVALPSRFKTVRDFYWSLDRWWIWLCLLCLPLEVIIRRWPELTSARG